MNISKFTQKSLQAVQNLEKTAYDFGNQEIEQEHLLYNLLHQEDSLILKMIEKMEINKEHFLNNVENALNARVKVSGGQQYPHRADVSLHRGACPRHGRLSRQPAPCRGRKAAGRVSIRPAGTHLLTNCKI